MRSARGQSSSPPARIGKIITPGENHHSEMCTAATAMAIVTAESTKAIRRFLVMNCLVSWFRKDRRVRSTRRRPAPGRAVGGRSGPFGAGTVGGGAETMMGAL